MKWMNVLNHCCRMVETKSPLNKMIFSTDGWISRNARTCLRCMNSIYCGYSSACVARVVVVFFILLVTTHFDDRFSLCVASRQKHTFYSVQKCVCVQCAHIVASRLSHKYTAFIFSRTYTPLGEFCIFNQAFVSILHFVRCWINRKNVE